MCFAGYNTRSALNTCTLISNNTIQQCWQYLNTQRITNWGEPERAPHYRGLWDHVHRPTDRLTDQSTDRPTDRPTDRVRPIHVILIRCTCPRCQAAWPLVSSPDQIFRARPADSSKNRVWTLSLRKLGQVYIWRAVNWVIVGVNYIISS